MHGTTRTKGWFLPPGFGVLQRFGKTCSINEYASSTNRASFLIFSCFVSVAVDFFARTAGKMPWQHHIPGRWHKQPLILISVLSVSSSSSFRCAGSETGAPSKREDIAAATPCRSLEHGIYAASTSVNHRHRNHLPRWIIRPSLRLVLSHTAAVLYPTRSRRR